MRLHCILLLNTHIVAYIGGIWMTKDHESYMEEPELKETSQPQGRRTMPWNQKFSEDENLKNRQYSRTARNQPAQEATTLSKVLLFVVACVLIVPFIVFAWMSSQKADDNIPARTASQVVISRNTESSSAVQSESSATSESAQVTMSTASDRVTVPASSSSVQTSVAPVTESSSATTVQPVTPPATPTEPTTPAGGTSYTVQAGDTWYAISRRYGVDVYQLMQANGANETTPIHPGQTVIIP